ncbi:MAG: NAD(P)/FAD-dependent oxidoreductase [Chitinophagaceae bacterium]|nr:NAD(P)/FAD-dependent oxidoreductase [Chitinophagaceae bacterium]
MEKVVLIIGAGPAGLTAAYELLKQPGYKPIIIEKSNEIGGISKTVVYKGNRIDIGGHRFFSKSETVMKWWQNIMPIQGSPSKDTLLTDIYYQRKKTTVTLSVDGPDPEKEDNVMLIRKRLSRIFFLRNFFDYPISLNGKTISNLGIVRISKIFFSYLWIKIFPVKKIVSLEDFFISRFGTELYRTFFKDYTEKVWGVPCTKIPADWGAQRIKELSVSRALIHAFKSIFKKEKTIEQKNTDTSLIEQFMYPKLGPGQMWELVAKMVQEKGCEIIMNAEVVHLNLEGENINELTYKQKDNESTITIKGDYVLSTMPIKELMVAIGDKVPSEIKKLSDGLQYRDFITVGLLLNKLKIKNETNEKTLNNLIPDNWIYIQEREVKVGRLQVFNNWSPYMVEDPNKVWLGLEYFCNEGDELWSKTDEDFKLFAIDELHSIDVIDKNEVIDSTILRVPKTYPAYFGTYNEFDKIKDYTNKIENLFLVGRNGMHKYNNQDHSMLTAITAIKNILSGNKDKENIWEINTEEEYHEKK